jgi:hypothetical protein
MSPVGYVAYTADAEDDGPQRVKSSIPTVVPAPIAASLPAV